MDEPEAGYSFLGAAPFGSAPPLIISSWFAAAKKFIAEPAASWQSKQFIARINSDFLGLGKRQTYLDPHLTIGRYGTTRRLREPTKLELTRPYLLMLQQFSDEAIFTSINTQEGTESSDIFNRPRQALFSPLFFLRNMLTSPEYLTSDAYAHAIIRAKIFATALEWPVRRQHSGRPQEVLRKIIDFERVSASIYKAELLEEWRHVLSGRSN